MRDESTCRGTRDEAISLGSAAVPGLIGIVADRDNDLLPRIDSAWALYRIGDKRALPVMVRVLRDPAEDRNLRAVALRAAGAIGTASVLGSLGPALADEDWYVRSVAAAVIGTIGDTQGLALLGQIEKEEDNAAVLYHVREARAKILVADAQDKSGELVRLLGLRVRWVMDELGSVGDAHALPALREHLSDATEWWEFQLIPPVILRIEDRVLSMEELAAPARLEALARELDSGSRPRNASAFPYASILRLGGAACSHLVKLLKTGVEPDISSELARFAVYKENADAHARLVESKDAAIRVNLAWILGELGDRRAVSSLVDLLDDPTTCRTHGSRTETLHDGGVRATHWDGREYLRATAAQSLAKTGGVSALPALEAALEAEKNARVRSCFESAVKMLKQMIQEKN